MTELRWGILATGSIARAFARHLPTSATGRLVAVASRDGDTARAFASRFDVPRAHAGYDALLADPDVDAVYVATPHPMHAEWAIRAAEAGKHVLCEKPLTMTEREAIAVVAAAAANDVFLMEAFMYRCHPQTDAFVRELGAIGEVREIEAVHSFDGGTRLDPAGRLLAAELGGGAILDVGCYCVSGARLVTGEDPVSVTGSGTVGPTGVDLRATATLEYASGVVAHLRCGIDVHEPPLLRVRGTKGTVTMDTPWLPTIDGSKSVQIGVEFADHRVDVAFAVERGLYAYEADVVAGCVARGERQATYPAPSWNESIGNMRTLDEWRRAVGSA